MNKSIIKGIIIVVAFVCCGISISLGSLQDVISESMPSVEDLYGDIIGEVIWENNTEIATYEVVEKQIGPYKTSLGDIKPIAVGVATVVRSKEDASLIRIDDISLIQILAENVQWQGSEFTVNADKPGIVRISSIGRFAQINENKESETMTIIANFHIE